jgi:Flp pilus assembly protein TadG
MILAHRDPTQAAPRRGAAVAEFAVLAPVLFMVVFGCIEFGRAMMVGQLVNNAARTGCRQGVLTGKSTSDIQTAVNSSLTSTGVLGGQVQILVNGVSTDASTAARGDRVEVRVSVPAAQNSWLPGLSFLGGYSLSGSAVMRRE